MVGVDFIIIFIKYILLFVIGKYVDIYNINFPGIIGSGIST